MGQYYIYPNELTHYGVLGMKWGVRRYQNPDGSLTEAGKKRYGTVHNLEAGRTKRQAKKYEAEKRAAINTGSAKEISKYSRDLTPEELAQAVQRINTEQTLSSLRDKEIALGGEKVNAILKKGDTLSKAYNFGAQVFNAFSKNVKMPIIGDQSNNKKKEISVEDQTKLFNLEQNKKKTERSEAFENILRSKTKSGTIDLDYFKKHASEFSTEELREVANREAQLKKTFKKDDKSK